ncbi:uncharacterized protein LOC141850115 [Brevipalpus obovatus]|uniref:uncharacterized protein LOC141850115 n=1 Tax=Brevipalpus obovatus TaxID=246614 RepID=UPI003D9E9523
MVDEKMDQSAPGAQEKKKKKKNKRGPNLIPREPRKRFSSIKTSIKKTTLEEKMRLKEQRKANKMIDDKMKAKKQQINEAKKIRREEAEKRKEENKRKGEVVQPIKNSAKLKRMSKKQLKKVRKA